MKPIYFTSSGFLTIKDDTGSLTLKGVADSEIAIHFAETAREIRRLLKRRARIRRYLSGECECNPDALR